MSSPILDYLPCGLVSYRETIQPALSKAGQGDFQPLRELMASARHVSHWPIFNVPHPLPALSLAGYLGWSPLSSTEPFWPQFLAYFWPRDGRPCECFPAEFFTCDYLDLWELFSHHLPTIFSTDAYLEGQKFLQRCLFYTLCCWCPTEELVDSRKIGNEHLYLWEEYISRTPEIQAHWDGFEHIGVAIDPDIVGWLSPEKTAHLLATVPTGERPFLYAVVSGCIRDYHYTWTNWPLSPELAALAVRTHYLRPNNTYPQYDKEEFEAARNNPDREVLRAYMREYDRKAKERYEEFERTAITDEEQERDIFRRMYLYWLEHTPEGFLEQNEQYYQALAHMESTVMGRFKYAAERGWGMLKIYNR